MPRTYRLVVGPADAGKRLDRFLVRSLPSSVSRSMIQRSILRGDVTVDERRSKAHRALRAGETVVARCEWLPAPATPMTPAAQPIPLEIVYEDASMLVVNKPPGLVTHPAPGHWSGTLVNAVLWHLNRGHATGDMGHEGVEVAHVPRPGAAANKAAAECRTRGRPALPTILRAGIVHRLDKDTSGLLLVAKTDPARFNLSKQLKDRTISRRYLSLVEGEFPQDHGTVSAAIGRHQRHRKRMTVRHIGGRAAVTHYRVLKRFMKGRDQGPGTGGQGVKDTHKDSRHMVSQPPGPGSQVPGPFPYSLLELKLETGRTHQIRVHLAHLGHPVLGDVTYSNKSADYWASLGIARQMLHAFRLSVRHPKTHQPLTFTARIPDDMVQWLPNTSVIENL